MRKAISKVEMRKMVRKGWYMATPNKGASYIVCNLPGYLLAAVRDGVEVTGELG